MADIPLIKTGSLDDITENGTSYFEDGVTGTPKGISAGLFTNEIVKREAIRNKIVSFTMEVGSDGNVAYGYKSTQTTGISYGGISSNKEDIFSFRTLDATYHDTTMILDDGIKWVAKIEVEIDGDTYELTKDGKGYTNTSIELRHAIYEVTDQTEYKTIEVKVKLIGNESDTIILVNQTVRGLENYHDKHLSTYTRFVYPSEVIYEGKDAYSQWVKNEATYTYA